MNSAVVVPVVACAEPKSSVLVDAGLTIEQIVVELLLNGCVAPYCKTPPNDRSGVAKYGPAAPSPGTCTMRSIVGRANRPTASETKTAIPATMR